MKLRHATHTRCLALTAFTALAALCLLGGCPGSQKPARNGSAVSEPSSPQQPDASSPAAKRELVKEYLAGDSEDLRQFALLFVLRYKLQEFRSLLEEQAVDDQLSAVVLDALSGDGEASLAWLDRYSGTQAQSAWFGAVYGFECASQYSPDFWLKALAIAKDNEVSTFCIGLARLDAEPGGPVQMDSALIEKLKALHSSTKESDVLRRFALDSLLDGREGWSVDYASYLNQPALLNTTPSQWAGLLSHAPAAIWTKLLSDPGNSQQQQALLLGAAAMAAPPGISYPGEPGAAQASAASTEELGILFAEGHIDRFPLDQIETLKQYETELLNWHARMKAEDAKGDQKDEAEITKSQERINELTDTSRGVIAELLAELRLACIRGDAAGVEFALEQVPQLPDAAASGVLSTIARYNSALASDEVLRELTAEPAGNSVAYWLVLAWGDRAPVRTSDLRRQLLTSPNTENIMLGQAYGKWLEQSESTTNS